MHKRLNLLYYSLLEGTLVAECYSYSCYSCFSEGINFLLIIYILLIIN